MTPAPPSASFIAVHEAALPFSVNAHARFWTDPIPAGSGQPAGPGTSRFFLHKSDLSPDELRFYTTVDYEERMAFIAVSGEDMVAVGRYDALPGQVAGDGERVAEVAFLVQDDHQGQGIGRHLLSVLTTYARRKGISEFEAYVLAGNRGMLRLFRSSGHALLQQLEPGVYTVEIPFSLGHRESGGLPSHDETADRVAPTEPGQRDQDPTSG